MKKLKKNLDRPLITMFGLKPEALASVYEAVDTRVDVNLGWLWLRFGRDGNQDHFVQAIAGRHSFHFGAAPLELKSPRQPAKPRAWVYLVDELPDEMRSRSSVKVALAHAGLVLTAGREFFTHVEYRDGRDFAAIKLPGSNSNLLFRDPTSKSSLPWSAQRAITLKDAMVLRTGKAAGALESRPDGFESTGDPELDALLSELT